MLDLYDYIRKVNGSYDSKLIFLNFFAHTKTYFAANFVRHNFVEYTYDRALWIDSALRKILRCVFWLQKVGQAKSRDGHGQYTNFDGREVSTIVRTTQ